MTLQSAGKLTRTGASGAAGDSGGIHGILNRNSAHSAHTGAETMTVIELYNQLEDLLESGDGLYDDMEIETPDYVLGEVLGPTIDDTVMIIPEE